MPLLSNRAVIAISAVVDIALRADTRVSSGDIAHRLHLRSRHLEPTLQALVHAGILIAVRGAKGGYSLAKPRDLIDTQHIIDALSATEAAMRTRKAPSLLDTVVLPTLSQAEEQFRSTLKRITVEDLVRTASLNALASYKSEPG
jgi:Rrf2 family transcriptional regulator, iron-sulfur cluster assembly transcription factor